MYIYRFKRKKKTLQTPNRTNIKETTLWHIIVKLLETKAKENNLKSSQKGTSLVAQWLESICQCRGHGFDPWSGKIPHAAEQLSLCATTTEPVLWSLRAATPEPTCCNC